MEIERKFTLKSLPDNLERYPRLRIEQAYLSTNPVVRVRGSLTLLFNIISQKSFI